MKYFITHIFNEGLPSKGLRKVTYLTINDEDEDEYFLGTDNNPLPLDRIRQMEENDKIFSINGDPIELRPGKSLFIDKDGYLYFADRLNAKSSVERLEVTVKEANKMDIKFKAKKYIPKILPPVNKYHEYV
jgi:hypothetical protein